MWCAAGRARRECASCGALDPQPRAHVLWQPDVCHGRIGRIPILNVCGRYGHGGIAGRKVVGGKRGYDTPGACAIFPRGNRGEVLPDPMTDPLYDACSQMDLGGEWWRRTVVRWSFRPTS